MRHFLVTIGVGVGLALLYSTARILPCLTGEVVRTEAVSAAGELLVATAPVCPADGQLFIRLIFGVVVFGGMLVTVVVAGYGMHVAGATANAYGAMRIGQPMSAALGRGGDPYLTQAQTALTIERANHYARRDQPRALPAWAGGADDDDDGEVVL